MQALLAETWYTSVLIACNYIVCAQLTGVVKSVFLLACLLDTMSSISMQQHKHVHATELKLVDCIYT